MQLPASSCGTKRGRADHGRGSNGLSRRTPARARSLTLRVTKVDPHTFAVAAINPSITGRGSGTFNLPHSSATSAVTGRMRSAQSCSSVDSHASNTPHPRRIAAPQSLDPLADLADHQHQFRCANAFLLTLRVALDQRLAAAVTPTKEDDA